MRVIGVNGFGRIGRYFTRLVLAQSKWDGLVVNDIGDKEVLIHLLKYDSIHGGFSLKFERKGDKLYFENGKTIQFLSHTDPASIPWSKYAVSLVVESTGLFTDKASAEKHILAGAKKVVISAPSSSEFVKTIVLGVNDDVLSTADTIVSNASCTTNNVAPMIQVIRSLCTIESAYITTVHSFTTDQRLHDAPHKDFRRARAATQSIVPTTTGAAKAITRVFPDLEGKIGGCGVRVPVPNGSFSDLTMVVKNPPSVEAINQAMLHASQTNLKGVLSYTEDPIVSIDVINNPASCLFDAGLTSVINSMVKVVGWYDNEAGYSNRLLELTERLTF